MERWTTESVCYACWIPLSYGLHGEVKDEPYRTKEPQEEICCFCGRATYEGIYVRVDASKVPFPSEASAIHRRD